MAAQTGPLTICVINLKGGVGKSTIAALLARQAFRRGLDVLAIDLDPQANLSQGLMQRDYGNFLSEKRSSIVEVFNGFIPPSSSTSSPTSLPTDAAFEVIVESNGKSLQLIPARFDFSDSLLGAIRPDPKTLARFLTTNFKHKEIIFIDCSPTESVLTTAAYHASGNVLVPVKPEYFATIGFPLLRQSLEHFRNQNRGHHISVAGVVINNAFYDGGNNGGPEKARALREIREEASRNGWKVYKREIEHSRGFPKIMRGDYSYPGNAQYFYTFANEFFESIGI